MSAPCYRAWGPLHGILGVCTLMSGPPVCVLSLFKFFVRSAVACAELLQSMCDRAVGDACICPNSYRDLYKTQHDCVRKKSKLRRSIVFRLRRTSPPRRRRCRRLASYGLLAFASYGLLALASYDRCLWTSALKGLEPQAVPAAPPAHNPDTGRRLHAWQTATRWTPWPPLYTQRKWALAA